MSPGLRILAAATFAVSALTASADSLWPEAGASLVTDNRAQRPGDVLTIVVIEDSKVTNAAATSLSKATVDKAQISALDLPNHVFPLDATPKVDANSTRTFDGKGAYELSGSMQTRLTAVVMEVLPNGNLVVEGSRVLKSVDDTVTVRIAGIVRPIDITADNTVSSASLAEAKITFANSGPIARSSRHGWLNRLIDFIWPF
jgi:flagellar L-ring protein precursor FlgH